MLEFDSIPRTGPWSSARIAAYCCETTIPIRLACVAPTQYPLVLSVWYLWEDGCFWCAVQQDSRLAQHLRRNVRCGYEIAADAPPYCGIRGTADVELIASAGPDILRRLIHRYLQSDSSDLAQWLLNRAATEVALKIRPRRVFSWDYRKRMATPSIDPA